MLALSRNELTWRSFFLAHFFEDDREVSVPTLFAAKQKKGQSIRAFVERFWHMTL